MEVRPFCETEVGAIPKDWKVIGLGTHLRRTPAYGINAAAIPFDYRFPAYIRITDITDEGRFAKRARASLDHPSSSEYQLETGDIVIARTGASVGKSYLYRPSDGPLVFAGFLIRVSPDPDRLVPAFVFYFAQSRPYWDWVKANSMRSGQPGINGKQLTTLAIPLPPTRAEQQAIAEALSDADALIESLEQLLAKKHQIKQGAMQELLTGTRRLPGFRRAWERRGVAELGQILVGKALDIHGTGNMRSYLRTKNVLDGRIDLDDVLWMPMTDSEFDRFSIEPGDVLLNEGQSLELVGRCSIYSGEFGSPCSMQNQLLRFRAHAETSPEFAAQVFRNCQRTGVFAAIATQTTSVAHLGSSRFANLRLLWPTDRLEQDSIAVALTDMDAEISAVEAKLAKTRQIKQGMMRELLTGRIRLR